MGIIRLAVLRVALLVFPREEEAENLRAHKADGEADHEAGEAAVVPRGVGSSRGSAGCVRVHVCVLRMMATTGAPTHQT